MVRFCTDDLAAAWLAGFIDGEGCVGFYEYPDALPGRRVKRSVSVSNTERGLIEAAKEAADQLGLTYTERWHSDENRTTWGGKPLGTLSFHHRTTYERMLEVLPLQGPKRERLELLVASYAQHIRPYARSTGATASA